MKVSDFDYELPPELIAQQPRPTRDASRMMVLDRQTGTISHERFPRLYDFFQKGDVLVLNESRVIPARIWGKNADKEIEFLFLQEINKGAWEVLCRPAKRVQPGDIIDFGEGFQGEVVGKGSEGQRSLRFTGDDVLSQLKTRGYAPLPPYIKRDRDRKDLRNLDIERYQTVFAQQEGSIAAPTAGLHFTPELLDSLRKQGVEITAIALHVGLATFQPIRVDKVTDHTMLKEDYSIAPATAALLNQAKKEGRKLTAVGTTSVRTLESAVKEAQVEAGNGSTDMFIYPGFEFKVVDRLLTNFHLPQSTLLMLVAAFAGHEFVMQAYREAVKHGYHFYSYGDCMLIL
jgi:S-adenosylmethionine:tRNA ribosyltransferase-isomerase